MFLILIFPTRKHGHQWIMGRQSTYVSKLMTEIILFLHKVILGKISVISVIFRSLFLS